MDLYLSLKFLPVILVNDTPCGFARDVDLRQPNVGNQLWGDCMRCFEKPSPEKDPMQVISLILASASLIRVLTSTLT